MRSERQNYLAYLLRVWCTDTQQGPAWRASLDSPHTGERHGFATLAALFTFLEAKTRLATPLTGTDTQDVDDDSVPSEEEERHDV
jgi:hypothetical protein